jgi:hypothetical protein
VPEVYNWGLKFSGDPSEQYTSVFAATAELTVNAAIARVKVVSLLFIAFSCLFNSTAN